MNFDQLNINEKRVAVAKDVLANIAANKLKPANIGYLIVNPAEDVDVEISMGEYLEQSQRCHVCALGGLFYSYLQLDKEVGSQPFNNISNCIYGVTILENLVSLFDFSELTRIEIAYEGYDVNDDLYNEIFPNKKSNEVDLKLEEAYTAELTKLKIYHNHFYDSHQRLTAIMKNIVRNNGSFNPLEYKKDGED